MAYDQVKWESKWIMNNQKRYEGLMHQKAVIGNIEKRHKILELERKIKKLESE